MEHAEGLQIVIMAQANPHPSPSVTPSPASGRWEAPLSLLLEKAGVREAVRPPARSFRAALVDRREPDLWRGYARRAGAAGGARAQRRRAAACDQRRADARARAARARRRRHLHPREDDARRRRAPDASQCRAPSEGPRRNGAALPRGAGRRSRRRSASSTASPSASTNWRTAIPDELREGYPTPAGRARSLRRGRRAARYPEGVPEQVAEALAHELALIATLDYAPYFLTVHDIVRFARSRGDPLPGPRLGGQFRGLLLPRHHRGRSGALRSAVRALRLARAQRAARHRRRFRARAARGGDPVHLRRYGRERAGLAASVITYRARSAIRETAKVFGLSDDVDRRARRHDLGPWRRRRSARRRARAAGLDPADPTLALALDDGGAN